MTITDRVKFLLNDQFCITIENITNTTTFEDLGADSLDIMEFILSLEEEFKIEIPDADLDTFSNVGDIIKYVETKIYAPR